MSEFKADRVRRHRSKGDMLVRGRAVNARDKAVSIVEDTDGNTIEIGGEIVATRLFFIERCRGARRAFVRFCKYANLTWKVPSAPTPVEDRWYVTDRWGNESYVGESRELSYVFEVSGKPIFLRQLKSMWYINQVHFCLDVGSPRFPSRLARDPG